METKLNIITTTITINSSTQHRTQLPTIVRSLLIINQVTCLTGSSTLRAQVEITRPQVVGENLLLTAMPTLFISQTNQTQGESFRMEGAPLPAKVRIMRTRGRWIPLASAEVVLIKQLRASTTLRSRALLITIMLWMKPSLGSCKIFRIIDQQSSRTHSNRPKATTGCSRTTSCCLKRAPTQGCLRPFIIANSQLVLSRWLAMCIRITTMVPKEQFKAWKCTYEQ